MPYVWWLWELLWILTHHLQMCWSLCEKQKESKPGNDFNCCLAESGFLPTEIQISLLGFLSCRSIGYGRKLIRKMTRGSNVSWIMYSINAGAYYAMNVSLVKALWVQGDLVWQISKFSPNFSTITCLSFVFVAHISSFRLRILKSLLQRPILWSLPVSVKQNFRNHWRLFTFLTATNLNFSLPYLIWTETTKEFVTKLDLKPSQKVLDVGCGIGGGDFYMAEDFDVEVVGIDLSINMISIALERAIGRKCLVEFEVADCTKKTYPDNTFDVIYSRDTILHIQVVIFTSFAAVSWIMINNSEGSFESLTIHIQHSRIFLLLIMVFPFLHIPPSDGSCGIF